MTTYRVGPLPSGALAASGLFQTRDLPEIQSLIAGQGLDLTPHCLTPHSLTIVFPPADHTHPGWRLAAVQSLARENAPLRVNAVAGANETAIAAAAEYLAGAPGVTGQYLPLDDSKRKRA